MKGINIMKVFLGGTCSGYRWRDKLIPMLKCDYYNPIVKNWSESDRLREVHERETSNIVLYTITSGIKGVYSIAEVVDDSNKRKDKVIFCNLYREEDGMQMYKSLVAVENLIKANGCKVFHDLESVANYINSLVKN
jgi:hypothetical protein